MQAHKYLFVMLSYLCPMSNAYDETHCSLIVRILLMVVRVFVTFVMSLRKVERQITVTKMKSQKQTSITYFIL